MTKQSRAFDRKWSAAAVQESKFTLLDLLITMLMLGVLAGYLGARFFIA